MFFDVSLCYNKTDYSYSSLWEAKEMKKIHAVETAEFSFLWHAP